LRCRFIICTSHLWVIKSRRMRWVGHAGHREERRGAYKVVVGKPE